MRGLASAVQIAPMTKYRTIPFIVVAVLGVLLASTPRCTAATVPAVTITIDDTVITTLLSLIANHDDSDQAISAWIDLPGNKELLAVGAVEGTLSRDQLQDNVRQVIDGTATDATQPPNSFGRIMMSSPDVYRKMIDRLHTNARGWLMRCANRDAEFAPSGVTVNQVVYLHLGGDWDAINRDGAIYINMQFFAEYFSPSWSGLDLLVSHETFHAVQNAAFGNPEATDTPDHAFYSALSKIQREGTARFVEVEADPGAYPSNTYGFYFRAVDQETIREFASAMPLVGDLAGACYPQIDGEKYRQQVSRGLDVGGPYYTVGEGMAVAIDQYAGQRRLSETVRKGPLDFFDCYAGIARRHEGLPQVPANALAKIESLRAEYPSEAIPQPSQQTGVIKSAHIAHFGEGGLSACRHA